MKRRLKQVKWLHKAVTRKQKGSNNRKQAARKLGKQYRHVANQRANTLHQADGTTGENHHVAQASAAANAQLYHRIHEWTSLLHMGSEPVLWRTLARPCVGGQRSALRAVITVAPARKHS